MSGFFGKVLGAVGAFSSRKASIGSATQDRQGKSDGGDMAPASDVTAKKRLFDDEEDGEDSKDVGASDSIGKASSFTINEEYARRYEHNKKREEKHKLEEKYGKAGPDDDVDDDSESSSDDGTEDEDGYLLTEDLDARMSEALQAIKNKDPRVYSADAKFFDAAEAERAGQEAAAAAAAAAKDAQAKPMFLRDYHRERYLRGDVGADDDDADDDADAAAPPKPKTYQQEQDEIKQALIAEMNAADESDGAHKKDTGSDGDSGDDSDDAFIKPKASTKASKASAAANSVHPTRAGRIQITSVDVKSADKDPELFLSNFMAARAWVPTDAGGSSGPGWEAFDSEDDDEETGAERAEAFEAAYNLRFEDPDKSNEVLKSYSRTVVAERSVRREDKSARQRHRDQERERQEAEKQARREERARLRKLNIDEAQEKLAKIKQAAGTAGRTLTEDEWISLLDGAWDNNEWEDKMKKQFGEDYYAEADADAEAELAAGGGDSDDGGASGKTKKTAKKVKKPKWDDDIDIKDIIPDFEDDEAVPKISLTDSEKEEESDAEVDDDDDDDDDGHQAKRRKTGKDRKKDRAEAKREARRERARLEALVERQMALDDPAALAAAAAAAGPSTGVNREGRPSLFRYRETSPQTFGLTARDILLAPSDAALNEFAGLKKLATFRDEERKRKDRKKLGKKARLRQWRRETFGADYEQTGPTFGFERFAVEGDDDDNTAAAAAAGSRKDKKRSKDKGKKDKGKEEGDKGDDGAAAASKKKRKRSGRKNKDKAKAAAE